MWAELDMHWVLGDCWSLFFPSLCGDPLPHLQELRSSPSLSEPPLTISHLFPHLPSESTHQVP